MRALWLLAIAGAQGCEDCCYKENMKMADVGSFTVDVHGTSPQLCQQECAAEPGCKYFTFYQTNNQCWLSKGGASYVASTENRPISGPFKCQAGPTSPPAPVVATPTPASEPELKEKEYHTPAAPPAAGALVGAGAGAFSRNGEGTHKESSSFGESLNSTPVASSLTSSSLSSLPKWAVLLLFCALALALCGALAMAMKKPKKKKTKRAKKTEEVPLAPVVETVVAPAVVAAPIQTYSVPYAQPQVVEYVQPQMVEYVQQPQMVEYVQQPQMVEYVQQPQIGSIVQGAPVVSYVQ